MSETAKARMPTAAGNVSLWQRWITAPLIAQLNQGTTPEHLARSIALGLVLGCFPILGSGSLLCVLAAAALRLNHPIIQLVNYFAFPLQLALLIPYYRAGEWLFGTVPVPLSIPLLYERFSADVVRFLHDYGMLALQGIAVWCLLAPAATASVYLATHPPLRILARRLGRQPPPIS